MGESAVNSRVFSTLTILYFLVIICCTMLLFGHHKQTIYNTVAKCMQSTDLENRNNTQINQFDQTYMLKSIASRLKMVEIHAKSMKALRLIRTVNDDMNKLFSNLGLDYNGVNARNLKTKPKTVCPEKYEGVKYGLPLSDKGFTVNQCSYGKPLSALITIVTISTNKNIDLGKFSEKCNFYFPNVSVVIGTNYSLTTLPPSVIIQANMTGTPGKMWNSLITQVSTPYILVARDVTDIDEHANVQRLIREKELFSIAAVGGSLRDTDTFHWKIGCYQRAFRNYTLVYQEGYDEAQHGCLVCDHVDGPFLMETKKLINIKFDNNLDVGVFEDFFLRLGLEQALVCPDVMFHVSAAHRQTEKFFWEEMASKHEIYKLKFIPGFEIIFPCKRPYRCHQGEKNIVAPCCMKELNIMTLQVMHFCEKIGIKCELQSGTVLGAIKMNMAFPWDIDADTNFLLSNYSLVSSKLNELNQKPIFWMSINQKPVYKNKTLILGAYSFNSKNWFVEIWGKQELTTSKFMNEGKNQTKALFYGNWVGVPANPGAWSRNRYGNDFYFHVEHWRELGRNQSYVHMTGDSSGRFRSCKSPGDHKCLDNFNAIGNIQFQDPIP